MTKVFLDTNVLFDLFHKRQPFMENAQEIWRLSETGVIGGIVSSLTINNLYYTTRKCYGPQVASKFIALTVSVFDISPVDDTTIKRALQNPGDDFEDACQFYSALQAKADCIVTRDKRHFRQRDISVFTPEEFLLEFQRNR